MCWACSPRPASGRRARRPCRSRPPARAAGRPPASARRRRARPPPPVPPCGGRGRPPPRVRRAPGHQPVSAKKLAEGLPARAWRTVTWREGSRTALTSRFAALRVRPAHRDTLRPEPWPEEWLLVEWPKGAEEPAKYWLSNLPPRTALRGLVRTAKARWLIERDYQELKQEIRLGHYEGRGGGRRPPLRLRPAASARWRM